jgi:hypothetical protein
MKTKSNTIIILYFPGVRMTLACPVLEFEDWQVYLFLKIQKEVQQYFGI